MGNQVELKNLVKSMLNSNLIDPYPSNLTRPGINATQFYTENDGFNISRPNSFPKGLIKINTSPGSISSGIGRTGYVKKYGSLSIYYYVKELQKYTENNTTYTNEDLVYLMLNKIETAILNNKISGYHIYPENISNTSKITKIKEGSFYLYTGYKTITYYWSEKYGE